MPSAQMKAETIGARVTSNWSAGVLIAIGSLNFDTSPPAHAFPISTKSYAHSHGRNPSDVGLIKFGVNHPRSLAACVGRLTPYFREMNLAFEI
jgi:hypothetical protein